jgi:hypothetical protein
MVKPAVIEGAKFFERILRLGGIMPDDTPVVEETTGRTLSLDKSPVVTVERLTSGEFIIKWHEDRDLFTQSDLLHIGTFFTRLAEDTKT